MASKRAILIAGGGSRGIFGAGCLKAISDAKIDYHAIFTSSVGSINGCMLHAGHVDPMIDFWLSIKTKDLLKKSPLDYVLAWKRGWLHDSKPLKSFLEQNVDFDALKKNPRDFWINATDYTNKSLYTREVKSLESHEIVEAVLASASPPVYMPMVKSGERYLCDSGVVNNFGLMQAIESGYNDIILVLCNNPNIGIQHPDGLFDIFGEVMGLSMNSYLERETKCITKINSLIDSLRTQIKPRKISLTVIAPERDFKFSFLDFDFKGLDRKSLIDEGYRTAMKALNG